MRAGRTFSIARFRAIAGGELANRLIDRQVVLTDGDLAFFRHHLFHDLLVARVVAYDQALWSDDVLDAITFDANAFDAVALVLVQLVDAGSADRFLVEVYDWNLYGAAYALARRNRLRSIAVSDATELAIVAMLAERR